MTSTRKPMPLTMVRQHELSPPIEELKRTGAILFGSGPPNTNEDPEIQNAMDYNSYIDITGGGIYVHRNGKWGDTPIYPPQDIFTAILDRPNPATQPQYLFNVFSNQWYILALGGLGFNDASFTITQPPSNSVNFQCFDPNVPAAPANASVECIKLPTPKNINFTYAVQLTQILDPPISLKFGVIKFPLLSAPVFPMDDAVYQTLKIDDLESDNDDNFGASVNGYTDFVLNDVFAIVLRANDALAHNIVMYLRKVLFEITVEK